MKALRNVGLALVILFTLTALPAMAKATTYTISYKVPINMPVFISCAAGGAGEFVFLSGNLHVVSHFTLDGNGGFHTKDHFQPQGVSGLGLTTGDKYQGTGVTKYQSNGKVGYEYTYVNNFRIIGQGPGNNFLIHHNYHYTINANGELTAWVDNYRSECK